MYRSQLAQCGLRPGMASGKATRRVATHAAALDAPRRLRMVWVSNFTDLTSRCVCVRSIPS